MQVEMNTTVEVGDNEIEVTISGWLEPPVSGRMYMPNGDPGYPAEGGYCESIAVYLVSKTERNKKGKFLEIDITDYFTDKYLDELSTELYEYEQDRYQSAKEYAQEAKFEQMRDDRLAEEQNSKLTKK